jgi:hypothetical protein
LLCLRCPLQHSYFPLNVSADIVQIDLEAYELEITHYVTLSMLRCERFCKKAEQETP